MSDLIRDVFHQNFIRLMNRKGCTKKEVADFMEVSPTTVGDWSNGIKVPRMDKIDRLCIFFGVERTDFLTVREEGSADISRSAASAIPIIGTIAAGIPIEAQQDIQGHVVPDERIRATFALRIKGDSMINANINDGDIVFIRKQESVEDGEIAAVYIDGEATLKKLYRHDGAIELRPANDDMRSMFFTGDNCREFKVLGKCVGYMHSFER